MINYNVDWTPRSLRQLASMKIGEHIISKTFDSMMSWDGSSETASPIVNEINQLKLPQLIKGDLLAITGSMRNTMKTWLSCVLFKWRLMVSIRDYVIHTHWTSRGTIDTAETVRSLYFAKKILLRARRSTFAMIASCCLEDCIDDFWPKVKELNADQLNAMIDDWKEKRAVLPLYWWYRKQSDLNGLIQYFEATTELTRNFYNNQLSIDQNMFILSGHSGSFAATKHFWGLLNSCDRYQALDMLAKTYDRTPMNFYELMEFTMFLWSEKCTHGMPDYLWTMLDFIGLGSLLSTWPWQDVVFNTLSNVIDAFELEDYRRLLKHLIIALGRDRVNHRCFHVFFQVWTKCPDSVKRNLDYIKIFRSFFADGDIKTANYVINHEIWRDNRQEILIALCDAWWQSDLRRIGDRQWFQLIHCTEEEKKLVGRYIDDLHLQSLV